MEGLEAVELKLSEVLEDNEGNRIDPEYFNKTAQLAYVRLKHQRRFGELVKSGYRVIYENTNAIDRSEGIPAGLPFFLQSADITTPFISTEKMICVSQEDWLRYPKGRIIPGEVLIEVKGKAEKVAIVPEDFPKNTLVTGTLYKMTVQNELDKYLLVSYLTCRYGQALKERLKTNLLVSFISKSDLYQLPVPEFGKNFKEAIKEHYLAAEAAHKQSKELMDNAEQTLLHALGLNNWQPPESLTYQRKASEAFAAERLDAEYFHPSKQAALNFLSTLSGKTVGEMFCSVRDLWQPETAPAMDMLRNYDLTEALCPFIDDTKTPCLPDTIASTKKRIVKGDIVVSRLRSYLKEIAVVLDTGELPMVASTEFIVLRPKQHSMRIETLLVYLRSTLPQLVFKWSQDGSNHPRFDEKELLNLRVPDVILVHEDEVAEKVRAAIASRQNARKLLDLAKRAVEIAIEESETVAIEYLNSPKEL